MGRVFAYLFSAVFAAAGFFAFYFSGFAMLLQSYEARSWVPASAQLQSYDLDQRSGDDGTTYKVMATYRYQYQGNSYTSRQVGFSKGYDNIGSYHQDMHRRLSTIDSNKQAMAIWVNPENPGEAVIDRDVRWGSLLFGLIFLVVFGGIGITGLVATYKSKGIWRPIKHAEPTKPWTMYAEWNSPTMVSNAKLGNLVLLIFAVICNALLLGGAAAVYRSFTNEGNNWALLGLVAPALGVFLIWTWYKSHRAYKLTGPMPLELNPYPGSVGGHVGGTIRMANRSAQSPQNATVKLQCVYTYERKGSDNKTETKENILWEQSMVPKSAMGVSGQEFSFSFAVPDSLPVSEPSLDKPCNAWRINFDAELNDGTKVEREYEDIPVFATAEQSTFSDQQAFAATSVATQSSNQELIESVLAVQQDVRGHRLDYPSYSNKFGLYFALFGLVFIIIGVLIPSLIFNIAFPLIGGLFFLIGAYQFLRSTEIRIGAEGISSQTKLFGFNTKQQFLPSYAFSEFVARDAGSSTTGSKTTYYYSVEALGSGDEKVRVAQHLKGRQEADAAIAKLNSLVESYR